MTINNIRGRPGRLESSGGQNNLTEQDMRKAVSVFTGILAEKMLERMLAAGAGRAPAAVSLAWQTFFREISDDMFRLPSAGRDLLQVSAKDADGIDR